MNIRTSEQLFARAQHFIPGGVNSPVRAFKSVGGTPIFFKSALGAVLTDVDGNDYIDYISSWGPMILGHAHPTVTEAIREATLGSTSFGAPTEAEIELAELIVDLVPNIDIVRMVNSGTEACMSAIRVARGYTGKSKIIKFVGCYHGHADSFLIKAGSGLATLGTPSSPGVTPGTAADTLTAEYNDLASVEALFEANKDEIAAIIIEPIAGNMGCILPEPGFLEGLRELCDSTGALLIFDEVMTGFRLALGGAQEVLNIKADLVTFGKVIGGGMPVGAYAGPKEIMDFVAPVGPVYQAGTLSGNPLAMASGLATLRTLKNNPNFFSELENKCLALKAGIGEALSANNITHQINQFGSMISVHFTEEKVRDYNSAATGNNDTFKHFFHHMLNEGCYLPPSAFESWFLNNALTAEQIEQTISATSRFTKS
ncbi:MAG: glutamate-1-semialdehyde 2,1-aminomutase [Saprospiraceae bacterium]|nr:glutamate-1-semialdehyde 2,1-aminomutase [Saprospiraceae bacterium]